MESVRDATPGSSSRAPDQEQPPLDAESLLRRYSYAPAHEVQELWDRVSLDGTPVWNEPDGSENPRVTFLWRAPAAGEHPDGPDSVHVHINRVTDKDRHADGFMQHVPGTDIWVLTVTLAGTLRACYGFTPLRPGEQPVGGPPELGIYWTLRDPLSLCPPLVDHGPYGLSVLAGPGAPPQPDWEHSSSLRSRRGELVREPRALPSDRQPRDHWLYLPPSALQDGHDNLPLLTLFDAETWFGEMNLPQALESAVDAERLPEVAVLGISNIHRLDRIEQLGANSAFLRDVAHASTGWAERHAAHHGVRFAGKQGRIVSGQSLGGLSALIAALELPQDYGVALAHSSSLWWTPDGRSTPRDLGTRPEGDWITGRFAREPVQDVRIRLDVGLKEGLTVPQTEILHRTLGERGWAVDELHLYDGGHDFAWWRGALLDGLAAVLPQT